MGARWGQEQQQQKEVALLWLAVAGVELEVWAALAGGVGTGQKEQVGAAWEVAWVMKPGVSLVGVL